MKNLPDQLISALGITAKLEIASLPGNENDNYLVKTDPKSFVVKRLRAHSATNTELEATYRDYLADSSLPVARYATLGGKSHVLTLDGEDFVATLYDEGKMAVSTKETVMQAAALLAKTHRLNASDMPQRQSWYRKSYISDSLQLIDDKYAAAKKAFADQCAQTTDFWDGRLPKGIIHGDLQEDNIIVNDQNEIVSIVDWEEAAVEPLLLDVAHSAQQLSFSNGVCDQALFTTFMEAYQNERPLLALEKTLFNEAVRYTMLVLSVWAHIKFSQSQLDEETFERVGNYYKANYTIPTLWLKGNP